jgi:hypothetical protein
VKQPKLFPPVVQVTQDFEPAALHPIEHFRHACFDRYVSRPEAHSFAKDAAHQR